MTPFEKAKVLSVKVRRAYWQWRAAKVSKATFSNIVRDKCEIGVVLSGGEFTPGGVYDQNYGYPIKETIDYYASKGMKIARIPFMWERVQPVLYGPLDVLEMSRYDYAVNYAIEKGMTVGIDVHNGGYYNGKLIGNKEVPNSSFNDLWTKLANHYKNKPQTLLMLMSEPYDQCARQWIKTANKAIAAIRATGATQTIVVPGSYYDGAWTWIKSDNAKVVGKGVVDPLDNYMFEVHQYMDGNAAGGTPDIAYSPTIGADRLVDITLWARKHGKKLFLGEFGSAGDSTSLNALSLQLQYVCENADVWKYATWWGAGDRWINYFMGLDPEDYNNPVDKPQMNVIHYWMNK